MSGTDVFFSIIFNSLNLSIMKLAIHVYMQAERHKILYLLWHKYSNYSTNIS